MRIAPLLVSLPILCAMQGSVYAQNFDPRQLLGALIAAFQNCGPPQTYQLLSPQLFQNVYWQTQGSGCYPQIRQAGPIAHMEVMSQQEFPAGPIHQIRVFHQNVAVDWFIGVSRFSGKVEYLNYQNTSGSAPPPPILRGPDPDGGPSPAPEPPAPNDDDDNSDGCTLYPAMCIQ